MPKQKVLVVDDEEDILELLRHHLTREGFVVQTAADGDAALKAISRKRPDLVVLDLMLPGKDGLEVCRTLKSNPDTAAIPILILTAKGEESDIVTGLTLGADDYVIKPFSIKVLIARMRAALRRQRTAYDRDASIAVHELTINPARHEVLARGRKIDLTFTEFRILHFLASRPGWVRTREQIVNGIRGEDYPVTERAVDVHIVALRRKLGPCGEYIETVRGVGYRFKE